jgi:adenosyl cobinamide kinase/adenosyl cobinamide phosphate guanylyltransferase
MRAGADRTASRCQLVITLVLGGVRSGKSEAAEAIAERHAAQAGAPLVYVATARRELADADLLARIALHERRRGDRWATLEVGDDLAGALRSTGDAVVLVDSLATWLGAFEDFRVDIDALIEAARARPAPTVFVSDEVGLGVHAVTATGRAFADALGTVNRRVAAAADEVVFVVAGRVLRLE